VVSYHRDPACREAPGRRLRGYLLIAFPIARYIEKTFVKFKPAGLVPLALMILYLKKPLDGLLGSHWGHFCYTMIVVLYCVALYPAVIKAFAKPEPSAAD